MFFLSAAGEWGVFCICSAVNQLCYCTHDEAAVCGVRDCSLLASQWRQGVLLSLSYWYCHWNGNFMVVPLRRTIECMDLESGVPSFTYIVKLEDTFYFNFFYCLQLNLQLSVWSCMSFIKFKILTTSSNFFFLPHCVRLLFGNSNDTYVRLVFITS